MKTKALIIDDNKFIIELLSDQLDQFHPKIDIIVFAEDGTEGIQKIKLHKPDLVFLDVEMGDMTGFEMLSQIKDIGFKTIFITSYSHYAIKAIRFNALDYLLKPIDKKELDLALKRYHSGSSFQRNQNQVHKALINLHTKSIENQTLMLHTQKGILQLVLKRILRIESDRNYSYIHLSDHTKVLSSKTLSYFEEILSDKGFFRCHRSFLVNGFHISNILQREYFLLSDNSRIHISRRKRNEAEKWFFEYKNG